MEKYDLVGIGFGPSNISMAIAIEEAYPNKNGFNSIFFEKQKSYRWHSDMILDHAHMQVSFLKDLVTLRNPTSKYSFINYLHKHGRLSDFINLKTFFPSRQEFDDYICWVAAQLLDYCRYGQQVVEIKPEIYDNVVTDLKIICKGANGELHECLSKNIVIGIGGTPRIPKEFEHLKDEEQVFHSHFYLKHIKNTEDPRRIAIIGAGQSAVEIFLDLHGRFENARIDLVSRRDTITPPDDSPFVNEIYNPETTDFIFQQTESERISILQNYWNTNYSAPDADLTEQLYEILYLQKVSKNFKHNLHLSRTIYGVEKTEKGYAITMVNKNNKEPVRHEYDIIILATGYERRAHEKLLNPLQEYFDDITNAGRHYNIISKQSFLPKIFLQGECEKSHGLSDSLLSVMPIRTSEILACIQPTR